MIQHWLFLRHLLKSVGQWYYYEGKNAPNLGWNKRDPPHPQNIRPWKVTPWQSTPFNTKANHTCTLQVKTEWIIGHICQILDMHMWGIYVHLYATYKAFALKPVLYKVVQTDRHTQMMDGDSYRLNLASQMSHKGKEKCNHINIK